MGRQAISEFQVKETDHPNAGRSWYIVGRPGGKRIRAWFDTQLAAEAAAKQRNLSIPALWPTGRLFLGCPGLYGDGMPRPPGAIREAIREALHDATAHYLRHLDSVTGRYR